MAALEWLCHSVGVDSKNFSREENMILEAELYTQISQQIWQAYHAQYIDYFHLVKFNIEKEEVIVELNIIRCLINDILTNEAYTLSGIAYYTQTPEEIIQDLFIGHKVSPLISFPRKLIELHKSLRPDLYQAIIKKL